MQTGINFIPILMISGCLIAGLITGLLKKPKKKWNWLWYGLTGAGCGVVILLLLGLVDMLLYK